MPLGVCMRRKDGANLGDGVCSLHGCFSSSWAAGGVADLASSEKPRRFGRGVVKRPGGVLLVLLLLCFTLLEGY